MTEARTAPGPRGHFLLGSVTDLQESPLQFFLDVFRDFGDVVRIQFGPITAHLLAHPDHVKHVLQDQNAHYTRQTRGFESLRVSLGNGLLTSEGDFWRRQRRIAQPAFHRQRIAAFAELMADSTERMVAQWKPMMGSGKSFDVMPELLKLTLRILGLSMFGLDLSDDSENIGGAVKGVLEHTMQRVQSLLPVPEVIPTPANRRFKESLRVLDRVVYGIIDDRRRTETHPNDLLSMLLDARDEETGESMNDNQLRDELVTFLGAGHETTAMALTWSLYTLSHMPAVRSRVESELSEVLAGRTPTLEDLPKLKYLRAFVDEVLRLYPPAWMVSRAAARDDVIGGYVIPAGSQVFTSSYVTHRHPAFWENPEGFDPERFMVEDPNRPRYAYFPFGGGPHLCIGNTFALMEAQLALAVILQRVRLNVAAGHPVEPEPLVTLRPKYGMQMTVTAR